MATYKVKRLLDLEVNVVFPARKPDNQGVGGTFLPGLVCLVRVCPTVYWANTLFL